MYLDKVKVIIRTNYEVKTTKGISEQHNDIIGTIKLDGFITMETLENLLDTLSEKVYRYDPVVFEIKTESENW